MVQENITRMIKSKTKMKLRKTKMFWLTNEPLIYANHALQLKY